MNYWCAVLMALVSLVPAQPLWAQSAEQLAAYERRIAEQQRQLDEMRRELEALKAAMQAPADAQAEVAAAADATPAPDRRYTLRKNENLAVTFSGRVHRMLLAVDDGANTDAFFTDSEQGPTMFRFDATGEVSDSLTIGGTLETGLRQNRPIQISQDSPESPTSVTVRLAEAYFHSTRYGRLSMGRGFAAAWLAPEIDLSGTQYASLLPVGMLAPGMKFVDAADNSLSDIRVLDHFVDLERALLVDRVRYDSVRFGPGLQLSGSIASDGRWDTALRIKPKAIGNFTLVGGAAYQDKPFLGIDRRYDAGASVLHNPTGLNLTVGGSRERLASGRNSSTYVIKAGWLADLVSLGKTAFSVDYYSVSDLRLDGDEGDSYGIFAVQKWPEYGLDLYAGLRRYEVDRPDVALKDLDVYAIGVGFNF